MIHPALAEMPVERLDRDALEVLRGVLGQCHQRLRCPPGWRYPSPHGLLLAEGAGYDRIRRCPRGMMGPPRECFNASRCTAGYMAAEGYGGAYVEGYALARVGASELPVEHAWVLLGDGTIIDPTWEPGVGLAYIGLPIDLDYMDEVTEEGYASALQRPGWPMLKVGHTGYLAQLPARIA